MFGNQNRAGFGTPTTSGTGLFGGSTATSGGAGFGGFGSGNTGGANTGGGFGSTGAAGGGLFANKPGGFGSTTTTTPTPTATGGFGTGGGFGPTTGTTGFGGATGSAFGGAVPPSDGTAVTPYNPVNEKDPGTSTTNSYQSITYMQPYQRYSFEELRLGDYNQGRRFGNASGQAGAFGASAFGGTSFGQQATTSGFGSTGGGFGTGTSAPSTFGQTQTTGGFGTGTGTTSSNPLFGATKPATSLFGGTSTTSQPSMFGGTAATSGGFGSGSTGGTGAFGSGGGSLFGNNAQQNKGLFGGTGATGFGGGGFGGQQTATSTANPFGGAAATTSPFGQQQQQQQQQQPSTTGFGTFGQQNQNQNQGKSLFGGLSTGTQQQQTGGGLFGGGGTSTGTSLFGQGNQQQQQQPAGGSLFGGQNQQTGTGSLFGGGTQQQQDQKPGLFGNLSAGATNTGASPFGGFGTNQTGQTTTGTALFGNTQNQQQQQKPSLFGASGTGGSLFGQNTATQGAFGNAQNQQQQTGGFGTSSLFGSTQQNQQQPQPAQQPPAPGSFQASLLDSHPYGHQSIFSGLPAPNGPSPGPLATPLSASMKQKQRTPLPVYKITPNAANRLITPPRRPGYGFSYSTYGTPSSTSSVSSLGGSLLGGGSLRGGGVSGSLGRSFGKSFSTSNLRKTFDPDSDSVLAPGALTGSTSRYSGGSLKRLTIDRSLRSDLFQRPTTPAAPITNGEDAAQPSDKLKKRVSFDSRPQEPETNGAIVRAETESPEPTAEELGFLRSIRKDGHVNGVNGTTETSPQPEMEQVRRNELAVVHENAEDASVRNGLPPKLPTIPSSDPQPGEYWMKPSRAELSKMTREELKHVEGFTVGRKLCGQVTFDRPVDLTTIDLDQIFGRIVQINVRSITVYPDDAQKPPRGKGLNVPSTLRIENSWPRGRDKKTPTAVTSGPLYEKHVERLRRVHNTEFVAYEKDTGIWVFRVPHFTTYGLEYEDEGESINRSALSAGPPDTPTPKAQSRMSLDNTFNSEPTSSFSLDESFVGSMAGVEDDTFDFKKRKMVPGAFGNQAEEIEDEDMESAEDDEGSFLEDSSTGSAAEEATESVESEAGSDEDEDLEMAGSFPTPHHTVEHDNTTRTVMSGFESMQRGTPAKQRLDLSGDWADQLQRTISPRKQDRDALREMQASAFLDRKLQDDTPKEASTAAGRQKGFTTSIDLMNSLFQQPKKNGKSPGKRLNGQAKGFEVWSPSDRSFLQPLPCT
jgi:nuclear pore complex protein Nup98-Nup96